jgi:hypothetical protein
MYPFPLPLNFMPLCAVPFSSCRAVLPLRFCAVPCRAVPCRAVTYSAKMYEHIALMQRAPKRHHDEDDHYGGDRRHSRSDRGSGRHERDSGRDRDNGRRDRDSGRHDRDGGRHERDGGRHDRDGGRHDRDIGHRASFPTRTSTVSDVCAECGGGRRSCDRKSNHNGKTWDGKFDAQSGRTPDGKLVRKDGSPMCFRFNIGQSCAAEDRYPGHNRERHICSLCGAGSHGAQDCPRAESV